MRILICATCWSWVAPKGTTCPDCQAACEFTAADPSVEVIRAEFGDPMLRLASVKLQQRELPASGSLVATTRGMLFIPFLQTMPDGAVRAIAEDHWSLRKLVWPFGRVRPFADQFEEAPGETTADLAALFLDSPGAVYVGLDALTDLRIRGREWFVTRQFGVRLRFTLQSGPDEWRPRWRQLLARVPAWERVPES